MALGTITCTTTYYVEYLIVMAEIYFTGAEQMYCKWQDQLNITLLMYIFHCAARGVVEVTERGIP